MKKLQITLLGFLLPILCLSQAVSEIKFNTQSIDFSLPPRTNISPMSIKLMDNYNIVNAPTTYGSILEIYGKVGHQTSQLYFGGWDNSKIRYREAFFNQNTWSSWITLLDSKNIVESDGVLKINGTGNSSIFGNLGIGNTNPAGKLDVVGSIANVSLAANSPTTANFRTSGHVQMAISTSATSPFTTSLQTKHASLDGHAYSLAINPLGGNVGIGTTDPKSQLDVVGTVANVSLVANALATANFRTNGYVQMAISTSDTSPFTTSLQAKHTSLDGNAYPLALNPLGGNVGVGTATPNATLDVNGNIAVGGLNAGSDASPLSKKIAAYNYQSIEAGAIDFLDFNTNRHATSIAFRAKNTSNVPQEFMRIVGQNGNVGIGTIIPDEKLTVKGKIHSEEIKVDLAVPADYVFQKYYTGKSELKSDYVMPTLAEIESFTKKNNHLPNVPSAKEVQQNGLLLGEMSNIFLQKIEELTLYAIEQDKKAALQQQELDRLKTENENYKSLAERLSAIEKELKK